MSPEHFGVVVILLCLKGDWGLGVGNSELLSSLHVEQGLRYFGLVEGYPFLLACLYKPGFELQRYTIQLSGQGHLAFFQQFLVAGLWGELIQDQKSMVGMNTQERGGVVGHAGRNRDIEQNSCPVGMDQRGNHIFPGPDLIAGIPPGLGWLRALDGFFKCV